jgi:hypothetical protein
LIGCDGQKASRDTAVVPTEALSVQFTTRTATPAGDSDAPLMALSTQTGRTITIDANTFELTQLDSTGRVQHRAGGRGSGPGEFLAIASLFPVGVDSVAVWDPQLRRVTVFDERLRLVYSALLKTWPSEPRLRVVGRLRNGKFVGLVPRERDEQRQRSTITRDTVTLVAGSLNEMPEPVIRLDGASSIAIRQSATATVRVAMPDAPTPRALAVCGDSIVVLNAELILIATGSKESRPFRIPVDSFSGRARESMLNVYADAVSDATVRRKALAALRELVPDPLVRARRAYIASAADIWFAAQRSGLSLERHVGNGVAIERLFTSSSVMPLNIDRTQLFGVEVDSSGLAALVVLRRVKARSFTKAAGADGCGPTFRY